MRIATTRIVKQNGQWTVEVEGAGFRGAGYAKKLSDALTMAVNNWLLHYELKRND